MTELASIISDISNYYIETSFIYKFNQCEWIVHILDRSTDQKVTYLKFRDCSLNSTNQSHLYALEYRDSRNGNTELYYLIDTDNLQDNNIKDTEFINQFISLVEDISGKTFDEITHGHWKYS